jgi:hypothetical protein
VDGKLVVALVDVIMVAKKCSYEAAKSICRRILQDHWAFDMDLSGGSIGSNSTPWIFHSIRLQRGSNGGGGGLATVCADAELVAEILVLIPGCELSVQLRKDMVRSFFGVGGSGITFESLMANPRIRARVNNVDNPLGAYMCDQEQNEIVRQLPLTLQKRDDDLQLALRNRDADNMQEIRQMQHVFESRVAMLEETLARRDQCLVAGLAQQWNAALVKFADNVSASVEELKTTLLQELTTRFANCTLQLVGHFSAVVKTAVKEALGLKKAATKRKTASAAQLPESQRATPVQAGPLSLALSTVALEAFPDMHFATFRKIRSSFGHHVKLEKLRLHGLDVQHADYVEKPLLWGYTGPTVEGGGARYVHLQSQRGILLRVFQTQLPTTPAQRLAGAPAPTESLEQRSHRLDAGLAAAERGMPWPTHVSELEPYWDEIMA